MEQTIETISDTIEAHGLGYAIEVGTLEPGDVDDPKAAELIKTAYDAMRALKQMADTKGVPNNV